MKKTLIAFALASLVFGSCSKDDATDPPATTVTVDTSMPDGTYTANSSGNFVEQNGTGTAGTAELGTDSKGTQFLHFKDNFTSSFATGTVTIYLSNTNEDLNTVFDPANGNPNLRLVAPVNMAGDQYFKLDPEVNPDFDYVVLWCASAAIPFGNAQLN